MKSLSEHLVIWLIRKQMISESDRELYEYSAYITLLAGLPVIITVLIGIAIGKTTESLCIVSAFMLLRKFSGGFHARNAWSCMILSCCTLTACIYLSSYVAYNNILTVVVICLDISMVIVSPVDSQNRRLDDIEKKRYKRIVLIIVAAYTIIYFLLGTNNYTKYSVCIAEAMIITAMFQVPYIPKMIKSLRR